MTIIAKASNGGNNIQTIDFNGQPLLTIELDGIHYTAVKPICENIGLNWDAQRKRINRDDVLVEGAVMMTAPSKGGNQDMLCLPIDMLNGWLFGVDTKRVKSEIKSALIQYKKECYTVLHDYWHTGSASHPSVNEELPSSVKDRNGLIKTVRMAMKRLELGYSEAFNLVLHRFNVAHVGDLTQSQVGEAVEYLHRLMFTGNIATYHPAQSNEPLDNTVYTEDAAIYKQLMKSGKFIAEVDGNGRLIMRELFSDEFITTMQDLPAVIRRQSNYSLDELSQINVVTSQLIAMASHSISKRIITHDNQA